MSVRAVTVAKGSNFLQEIPRVGRRLRPASGRSPTGPSPGHATQGIIRGGACGRPGAAGLFGWGWAKQDFFDGGGGVEKEMAAVLGIDAWNSDGCSHFEGMTYLAETNQILPLRNCSGQKCDIAGKQWFKVKGAVALARARGSRWTARKPGP